MFMWQCPKCSTIQPEYIVDGSPSIEVLCEKCGKGTQYHELTEHERLAWDFAIEDEKGTASC